MKIVNPGNKDYHMHSLNYSDGMNTVDELVKFAGKIGLEEIAITDHSDASQEKGLLMKGINHRILSQRWKNLHNDVNVIFGVEADILDDSGESCFTIHGFESDFVVLSLHKGVFKGDFKNVTEAYINAIKKYSEKIDIIGHPCLKNTCEFLDIKRLCEVANKYNIALEVNGKDNLAGDADLEKQKLLITYADKLYINSDSHTLYELKEARKFTFKYLEENNLI